MHPASNFNDIRRVLETTVSSPFFLGSKSFLSHVRFYHVDSTTEILVEAPANDTQILTPAKVQLIGHIDETGFALLPCGGWNSTLMRPFEQTKASCTILPPVWPSLDYLWDNVSQNLTSLPTHRYRVGLDTKSCGKPSARRDGAVKVQHSLFLPVNNDPDAMNTLSVSVPIRDLSSILQRIGVYGKYDVGNTFVGDEWIQNCAHLEAQQAMARLLAQGDLRPNPLPVYDGENNLLGPKHYGAILPGALVHVTIVVSRQHLPEIGKLHVYADIERLQVLRPKLETTFRSYGETSTC